MNKPHSPITFNRPVIVGNELDYIRKAVESMHTSGDGVFTREAASLLERSLGVDRVLLTPSCTAALEMCALLLDLDPRDEFIVPSFSFVSTANAFALRGARPVFADIREDTLNIDESRIESLITPRTRVLVVMHYGGVGCEMDAIEEIARRHDLVLVEDNAHGLFGSYRGRPLGTFAPLATLSFHETKNFTCGEGGALLVNDPQYAERAEFIRDKGTNRQQLFRGQVDKYTWVDLGSSYVLSDILSAYLFAQLEARDRILTERRRLWETYDEQLRGWIEPYGVRLPTVPPHCEQGYHVYYLVLPSLETRQELIAHLAKREITAVFHYVPLHLSRMGRTLGSAPDGCSVTEQVSDRLLRLPFYLDLSGDDQQRVVDTIREFFEPRRP
jgi:dTDP-4-amino-4,6-dideoxygalactose transaminase